MPRRAVIHAVETVVHKHLAKRPGGQQVVIHEIWEFVDVSLRRDGTEWVPGGKRYALSTGETVHRIDEFAFQLAATGAILILS